MAKRIVMAHINRFKIFLTTVYSLCEASRIISKFHVHKIMGLNWFNLNACKTQICMYNTICYD